MRYKVGDEIHPAFPRHDFTKFGYTDEMLTIGMQQTSYDEIENFKNGKIYLKLIELSAVIFLIYKIGNLPWSDAPYSICLHEPQYRKELEKKIRKKSPEVINLILADVDTHIVLVSRVLKLSSVFAKTLNKAVLNQCENPHTIKEINSEIDQTYQKYNSKQLANSNLVSVSCIIK